MNRTACEDFESKLQDATDQNISFPLAKMKMVDEKDMLACN